MSKPKPRHKKEKSYNSTVFIQGCTIFLTLFLCCFTALGLGDDARRGGWNLPANATAHASVTGLMSGFIAAIIVLFITSKDRETGSTQQEETKFSIAIFITAFFHCVLSSFLYATFSGIPLPDTNPSYDYTFSLSKEALFSAIPATKLHPLPQVYQFILDLLHKSV